MLNKKGSRQCLRVEVQSNETSMDRWSAAWPWGWWRLSAGACSRAADGRQPPMDWC